MKKKQENKPLPEGVIISDSFRYSTKSKFFKFVPKNNKFKKPLFIGLAIVIIGVAGFFAWSKTRKQPDPVVLRVGKYSYTQSQYTARIAQAKDLKISEYEARKALKEAFASRQAADDLKISYPTDQYTLNAEAVRDFKIYSDNPSVSDYQRDVTYTELIKPFVIFGVHGGYKVGYVEFPFSRYIVEGDASHWHNVSLINDDINYAKTQAGKYRDDVATNKISVAEAADKVRADTRLTYGQAANGSGVFYADNQGNMYSSVHTGNAVEAKLLKVITQAQVGKVTDLMTKTWSNDTGLKLPAIDHGSSIDVAYYFVLVQEKTAPRPSLQTDYEKKVQEYAS